MVKKYPVDLTITSFSWMRYSNHNAQTTGVYHEP